MFPTPEAATNSLLHFRVCSRQLSASIVLPLHSRQYSPLAPPRTRRQYLRTARVLSWANLPLPASLFFPACALLRRCLVTAQIAVTIVLLSGAALLLRSFLNMKAQNLGMQTGGVLTVRAALPSSRYNTDQREMEFYLQLEVALRRLPDSRAVGMADSVPPGGWQGDFGTGGSVVSRFVTPDYFHALNIPIVRGRDFNDQDRTGNESEVILSRSLAAPLFPDDAVGKRIPTSGRRGDVWSTVVGDNVKNSGLTEQSGPEIYFLRRSVGGDWDGKRSIVLLDNRSDCPGGDGASGPNGEQTPRPSAFPNGAACVFCGHRAAACDCGAL